MSSPPCLRPALGSSCLSPADLLIPFGEATHVPNVLVAGDGAGYHGENSPPPASDPDELRRRAAKERIRARILREEAEAMALEAEVRRELMEERARLLVGLAGVSEHGAAPSLKTASPYFHEVC